MLIHIYNAAFTNPDVALASFHYTGDKIALLSLVLRRAMMG